MDDDTKTLVAAAKAEADHQRENKDQAYRERNMLVALLASMFPSGIARTEIEGWDSAWHGCVYIDFPWGQASWHYHDSQSDMFAHLRAYAGSWDGHTTEAKYDAIMAAARLGDTSAAQDRRDRQMRAEGMRMAAEIVLPANGPGWTSELAYIKDDILAAAEKEAGNE